MSIKIYKAFLEQGDVSGRVFFGTDEECDEYFPKGVTVVFLERKGKAIISPIKNKIKALIYGEEFCATCGCHHSDEHQYRHIFKSVTFVKEYDNETYKKV